MKKETISKIFSNYIGLFNDVDKILIVLSATSGCFFIDSFATVIGAPVGIISARFCLVILFSNATAKKNWKTMIKKK